MLENLSSCVSSQGPSHLLHIHNFLAPLCELETPLSMGIRPEYSFRSPLIALQIVWLLEPSGSHNWHGASCIAALMLLLIDSHLNYQIPYSSRRSRLQYNMYVGKGHGAHTR